MRSSRGIIITVLLAAFVLALFGAFTLLFAEPGQEGTPTTGSSSNGSGNTPATASAMTSDAAFAAWMAEARANITDMVEKIKSSGMSMDIATALSYDRQLENMTKGYTETLDNMAISSAVEPARAEFREALSDYTTAAQHGGKGAENMDMNEVGVAMDYFKQASNHADAALRLVDGSS